MDHYTFAFTLNEGPREVWTAVGLDAPGIVTEGDGFDAALAAARDALDFHLEGLRELGQPVPVPRPVADLVRDPLLQEDLIGAVLMPVPAAAPPSRAVRVNISLDELLLARVDAFTAARGGSRSAFIQEAVRRLMSAEAVG